MIEVIQLEMRRSAVIRSARGKSSRSNGCRSDEMVAVHSPPHGAGAANESEYFGRSGQNLQLTVRRSPPPDSDGMEYSTSRRAAAMSPSPAYVQTSDGTRRSLTVA